MDVRDTSMPLNGAGSDHGLAALASLPVRELGKRAVGRVGACLNALCGSRPGSGIGILVYHRISPVIHGLPKPTINVSPDRLEAQLLGLQARGFRFRPLAELLRAHHEGAHIPPRTVVVTFDDGYENVLTGAAPVLRRFGIPATVFVNTAFLDCPSFPFDGWARAHGDRAPADAYRPLSSLQCRELLRDGLIAIGAHTHTHRPLGGDPPAFQHDLQVCVDVLRARFGLEPVPFAFPFGRFHLGHVSEALMEAARQTGVTCGLTTQNETIEPRRDPFGWGRFNVFDFDTAATLAAKLEGWYGWAPAIQEWASRRIARSHA